MKRLASLLAVIALALSYLAAAKLGLQLAYVNDYTTAVWPPTGIALAALLLWGYRLWPGILLGAFLANVTVDGPFNVTAILASAGIAAGNTLEALVGAYLVNRFAGGRRLFERAQDVFRFALVAALVSTSISSTIGVMTLCIAHLAKWVDAPAIWITWWIGDAGGDLVFAPTMILCATDWRPRWNRSRALEAALLALTTIALSVAAFTGLLIIHASYLDLAFLCVPAVLWAAFRFGQRETAVTLLLVSSVAVWCWVHGPAPAESSRVYELLELQAYFCVTSLTLMAAAAEVSNRRLHQNALKRLAAIVESSDDAMFAEDTHGIIVSWNAAAERVYGYTTSEALGQPSSILLLAGNEKEPGSAQWIEDIDHHEMKLRRKDGTVIDISLTRSPIKSSAGALTGFSVVARDITDRKRMEEQFRQAQKLESIGLLAGGVAHDFNNILVGILGNASLALEQLPPNHPAHALLEDVVLASQRAAAVVNQLLTYAGRGEFLTQPVQLPEVVSEVVRLVQPSIPKQVTLRIDQDGELPVVSGDAAQIQQILMNLIINAAEAIGEKPGSIVVTLKKHDIAQPYLEGDRRIKAGRYAEIRVQDTGAGMDEKTRTRIFEPFFTTKFTGRGLGMAAVLGIVRRHQGAINVFSAPGQGATFEVLLPAVESNPIAKAAAQAQRASASSYLM